MATNFAIPFALTTQGTVATVTDPNQIALQRVRALISTNPGARVMVPDYGVGLTAYLFAPDLAATNAKLTNEINQAFQRWEPSINLLSVKPVTNDVSTGIDDVTVEFTTSNDPAFNPTLTATVLVGGTVVNN